MEIRDPIHGSIEVQPPEVAVIDSPSFQRLRTIKQLGFGEFSYPGATHNRYIHSLGVFHLAGEVFDIVFRGYPFVKPAARWRMRQVLKLAALLHDIGHGPLSHTTEEVMPSVDDLKILIYKGLKPHTQRKANHEDFTIKFITDSPLTEIIRREFPDFLPVHIACLIDPSLPVPDDFFIENGVNFRPLLSQLVSSELDCDRMDYLLRDSYFCGTDYGRIELKWLIGNLSYHQLTEDQQPALHLALSRRAIYTFDDFLISRHHMYLMVYFHHKAIIYDEMLHRYLLSPDCTYRLPANIETYLNFTDYHLYEHLKTSSNPWAKRISARTPYRMLFELHETAENPVVNQIQTALEAQGVPLIRSGSVARLSKYHTSLGVGKGHRIFVIDPMNQMEAPYPLEESTDIFQLYEKSRRVERIYVPPEEFAHGQEIMRGLPQRRNPPR